MFKRSHHKEDQIKRDELLNELQSLKSLLREKTSIDPSMIPVLNDIIDEAETGAKTEERHELDTLPPKASSPDPDNIDREIFIQEVIDSMIPQVEAELRRRMLNLDDQTLANWYQHTPNPNLSDPNQAINDIDPPSSKE